MDDLSSEDLEIKIKKEEALKRSYKLSEICDGRVGDLSTYVHNREFTVDHIISKGVWRFLVIDNTDEERADGASLFVFNQATCPEDRFFELDAVRKILVLNWKKKRLIFAYTPNSIQKREKFEKKSRDVMAAIYPQGPFKDIRWRKGSKTLRDEIKVMVGDVEFQKLMDDASVVFNSEQHLKYLNAVCNSSVELDNLYSYGINMLNCNDKSSEVLYDLFAILISEADELFDNEDEEITAEVIKLARSKDVFSVHLPVPHYELIKTHMDNALKVVELLEGRSTGERCLTRVVSMYGGFNKTDLVSILAIEESPENHVSSSGPARSALSNLIPDTENQADVVDAAGSGCGSSGLPIPGEDDNQAEVSALSDKVLQEDENPSSVVDLSSGTPSGTTLQEAMVFVSGINKIFDYSVDPNRFATFDWSGTLVNWYPFVPVIPIVNDKCWEAFEDKFQAWERTLPNITPGHMENPFVYGMTRLEDASPEAFVTRKIYQGHEIKTFTSEGVTFIQNLLFWMNKKIHQFSFIPDLMSPTAKGNIYYDEFGLVVNIAPKKLYQQPMGMPKFRELVEEDIGMLIEFICNICGGKENMPIMSGHMFEVMKNLESWIEYFNYIRKHPVLWSPADLDDFCNHMMNEFYELNKRRLSRLSCELHYLILGERDWWIYVFQNIHLVYEGEAFRRVFEYTLNQQLEDVSTTPIDFPIKAIDYYEEAGWFSEKLGILYWTRELFSHLVPARRDLCRMHVFDGVMLLFPVYFCQLALYLFKLGYRSWIK